MKHYKVIFDKKEIDGINICEEGLESAMRYVNVLVESFESYGFKVVEV